VYIIFSSYPAGSTSRLRYNFFFHCKGLRRESDRSHSSNAGVGMNGDMPPLPHRSSLHGAQEYVFFPGFFWFPLPNIYSSTGPYLSPSPRAVVSKVDVRFHLSSSKTESSPPPTSYFCVCIKKRCSSFQFLK
jgi:hypothetical protein